MPKVRSLLGPSLLSTVALLGMSGAALAEDLVFTLSNESSVVISEFYASPSDVAEWEEDILGADVLGSDESTEVTIADGREQCEYDLRFVTDDGTVVERGGVDLCELGSYTLTD